MPRFSALLLLASIATFTQGQSLTESGNASQDRLYAVHEALFASFLPINELTNKDQVQLFLGMENTIWSTSNQSPDFRRLLLPFADLRGFGRACGVSRVLHGNDSSSYAGLSHPQQRRVLYLLETCDQNELRRMAMTVRNFYVANVYRSLEEQLTGIDLNLSAPHKWIEQHRPHFPASQLSYHRENHEITRNDGAIDYLVVGSGPAGSVLAHELRRGGKHVVLVERGSFIVPGAMQTRLIGDLLDTRTSDDGAIIIHNGMAVGGGSQVNVDLCFAPTLPAIQTKINSWRQERRISSGDFTYEQLTTAYEWVKTAIGTRPLSEAEINANNQVLWNGARREGLHPKLYDLNTYAPGRSPYPVTDKRSSESQLLLQAIEDSQNPLSVIPDADVRRVLFTQTSGERQAIGVEVRMHKPITQDGVLPDPNGLNLQPEDTITIHAKTVILSAGALGSPAILLRSEVQNDQIGRGLILHPSMPILGVFDHTIDALKGTQASVYVDDHLIDRGYALESMSADPAYAAVMSLGSAMHTFSMLQAFRDLAGFGVMLVDTPSPQNRLTLDNNGEPRIHYELSEADKLRFRQAVSQAIRVMLLAGAKQVYLPTDEDILDHVNGDQPTALTDIRQADQVEKNLRFIPNRSIITSAHMQGTNKMGSDPRNSVVGRDFHVWGTKNLYVVDGSVFPTSVGANPMQTIYTFAKIFADRMNDEQ